MLKYTYKNNIFIPSKGRSEKCITADLFNQHLLSVNLVVEPQDWYQYHKKYEDFHNIIVLPENDLGITYVRNYIKKYAMDNVAQKYFWMMDDDVKFHEVNNKKVKPAKNLDFLDTIPNKLNGNYAQIGFEYQQFAWSQEKVFTENSYCDVAVAINLELTKNIWYDEDVQLKEDRDFTMQCLQSGSKTIRYNNICVSCPTNGSNDGGLKEVYQQSGRELQACENMRKKWGEDICNIQIKPSGRTDLKIHWKNIRSGQQSLF
jgi:hypothetical protein